MAQIRVHLSDIHRKHLYRAQRVEQVGVVKAGILKEWRAYKAEHPLSYNPEHPGEPFPPRWWLDPDAPTVSHRDGKDLMFFSNLVNVKDYFRNVSRLPEIHHRYGGWYTDDFCHETITGFVCQLPSKKGKQRWLHGIEWSDSDCTIVFFDCVADTQDEAARLANNEAESHAERDREANAKYALEQYIENMQEARDSTIEDIEHLEGVIKKMHKVYTDLSSLWVDYPDVAEIMKESIVEHEKRLVKWRESLVDQNKAITKKEDEL